MKEIKNEETIEINLNMKGFEMTVRRASDDAELIVNTNDEHYLKRLETFCTGSDFHVVNTKVLL